MKVLVTGGTGFLGKPLVKRLQERGHLVKVLSRNQGKLIDMKGIEIFSGDVSIYSDVYEAMQDVQGVYHLAASKHVGLAERLVTECVRSNVVGSYNVYECSREFKPEFVMSISTDKACQVAGIYGATKLLMEGMSQQYQTINPETKYRMVRYGNVLYSTGSVLCKWKDAILNGEDIVVTEPEATRFFWTVEQALDLIDEGLKQDSPTPYVPEMKGMSIENLLIAMCRKYGGDKYVLEGGFDGKSDTLFSDKVKIIGLQPGENMHERILENGPNSNEVTQFTVDEIMELI